ncbi:hypothetical protein B6D03_10745 [Gilliamella apicola]|nr:hypothetical protein B6D03_10745 [Gilliamella apicola]
MYWFVVPPLRFGIFGEITIRYDFTQLFNKVVPHTVELAQRKGLLIENSYFIIFAKPPQQICIKQLITLTG